MKGQAVNKPRINHHEVLCLLQTCIPLSSPRIYIHKDALEREAIRESLYYERMRGEMKRIDKIIKTQLDL